MFHKVIAEMVLQIQFCVHIYIALDMRSTRHSGTDLFLQKWVLVIKQPPKDDIEVSKMKE